MDHGVVFNEVDKLAALHVASRPRVVSKRVRGHLTSKQQRRPDDQAY